MTSNVPCQGSVANEETVIRPIVPCPQTETSITPLQNFLLDHPASVGSDATLQERQNSIRGVVANVSQLFPSRAGHGVQNNPPQKSTPTDLAAVGSQFSKPKTSS